MRIAISREGTEKTELLRQHGKINAEPGENWREKKQERTWL